MTTIAFDTETYPIRDGNKAPRMVCLSSVINGGEPSLLDRGTGARTFLRWMQDYADLWLVGHNLPFDLGVVLRAVEEEVSAEEAAFCLARIFELGFAGRLLDTLYQEKYLLLATVGRFPDFTGLSLADLAEKYLGKERHAEKKDYAAWRLRYNELDGVPLADWPEDARTYALDDAADTWAVASRQVVGPNVAGRTYALDHPDLGHYIPRATIRTFSALCLHLVTIWGVRTSPEGLAEVRARLEDELDSLAPSLLSSGILKPDGKVDTAVLKAAVVRAAGKAGVPVPKTKKGAVRTNKDNLEALAPYDEDLGVKVQHAHAQHYLTSYVAKMEPGTRHALCPDYDAMKETGRTSSFGVVPFQQTPRSHGVRECFVPREGHLFVSTDYDSAELRGWAEVCLHTVGKSALADRYREDVHFDPHLYFAARMLGITFEGAKERKKAGDPAVKEARQLAKIPNFGYPGGMGAARLPEYARGFGMTVTPREAERLREIWFSVWPEARPYFQYVSDRIDLKDSCTVVQLYSGRVRANCRFTEACNTYFQGIVSDGALDAQRHISYECYVDTKSPLFGCRPVGFIHDEFLLEAPGDIRLATAAADRLAEVARERMQVWMPSVPVSAEPVVSTVWSKSADSTRGADGLLSIWSPK